MVYLRKEEAPIVLPVLVLLQRILFIIYLTTLIIQTTSINNQSIPLLLAEINRTIQSSRIGNNERAVPLRAGIAHR
jgi:hypothetical protein